MRKSLKKNTDTSYGDELNTRNNAEASSYINNSIAFAKYIEDFKRSPDFRQRDIGEKLGIDESQISRWLSGFHNLTIKSILKLESASTIQLLNPAIFDNPKKSELESTTYSFTPNFLKENTVNDKTMGKVITMPTSTAPVSFNAKVADYAL